MVKVFGGIPEGYIPFVLNHLCRDENKASLFITTGNEQTQQLEQQLKSLKPTFKIYTLLNWDCLPYDRVGPSQDVVEERINTFLNLKDEEEGFLLILSVKAYIQKVAPLNYWHDKQKKIQIGERFGREELIKLLISFGYKRCDTVYQQGDFSVRGHLVDVFLTATEQPFRIDFFDKEIETLRPFDIDTQTTYPKEQWVESILIKPASEVFWNPKFLDLFEKRYKALEGDVDIEEDAFFEAIMSGKIFQGHEHFSPLSFNEAFVPIEAYAKGKPINLYCDYRVPPLFEDQKNLIVDYYKARLNPYAGEQSFKPLPPDELYRFDTFSASSFSPFVEKDEHDFGARILSDFPTFEHNPNFLEEVSAYINDKLKRKKIYFAHTSEGIKDRIFDLLQIQDHPHLEILIAPFQKGFMAKDFILITDQDVLGERNRSSKIKKKNHQRFFKELNDIVVGDLVVHKDHGIGRYLGLQTLTINENQHDCLIIEYHDGNKLYLPVENMELISRYGNNSLIIQLDSLGSKNWLTKTGKVKKRIQLIADYLIELAAKRSQQEGDIFKKNEIDYKHFCQRFPYVETDDQFQAIEDVFRDLSNGKPMDRLICGDVGFGKTEVALRAAFLAANNKKQVAIVTPTTLLCRQHFQTFLKRFVETPYRIAMLSRLMTERQLRHVKEDIKNGSVDILVATHSILAKDVEFKDLGLLIIDEEQHFGVNQKEKLKQNTPNVHSLTLSATPIPRTLQMSLTGVRDLSLITTPPVDRLPVRTFVLEEDPITLKEAILREIHRGGQVFYVCPHIEDQDYLERFLKDMLPDLRFAIVNGRMKPSALEDTISNFCERRYDLLLSTNIIESGIDMPSVNTIILHKAHLFGLSALYQLRGRVGRSKIQAFAYFTVPAHKNLTDQATKRLKILQSLDTLGGGFNLANHDLDLRGAGNIVGEEQSGHIKEVGMELYQQLLQETILKTKANLLGQVYEEEWTPQINLGGAVLIPERYIADLGLRLNLYKRLSNITDSSEIHSFSAELVDRFGKFPQEVKNLLEVCDLKILSKKAHVEKIEVGPKGFLLSFHNNIFPNGDKLLKWLQSDGVAQIAKLRPDQKIFFQFKADDLRKRYAICRKVLMNLIELS